MQSLPLLSADVAIDKWRKVLGVAHVLYQNGMVEKTAIATFPTTQKIIAILKPASTIEVQQCIEIANQYKIPIYPISKGFNWGLGSKVPVKNSCVLLDLGRMNRIVDFDETMAYVRVEPGVSFQQLFDFLAAKNSGLMLDGIGGAPEASIVGNTVERGHGLALYADRFNYVCGLEVVLGNGEVINTGYEHYQSSLLGKLSKWGLGPYIDGIFTQSNLGIVTQLTLWLKPKPKYFQTFLFKLSTNKQLAAVTDICRQFKLEHLPISLRLFNDFRLISVSQQYPWELSNQQTPLPPALRTQLAKQAGNVAKWTGFAALYTPSKELADATSKYIATKLKPVVDEITFFNETTAHAAVEQGGQAVQELMDFFYYKSILRGFTSDRPLNMCYWRKPFAPPLNKDVHKDKCGVIWFCPCVPNEGKQVQKAVEITESVCRKYDFEPNIGFLAISERVLDVTGALCYDRNRNGQDEKAMQCYNELMQQFIDAGYSPYRLGIQSMHLMTNYTENSFLNLLNQLKTLLDPNHILAPGRYIARDPIHP